MTEYVHLIGAEEATRAGNRISAAADQISRSAGYAAEEHERFLAQLDERITRFADLVERAEKLQAAPVVS